MDLTDAIPLLKPFVGKDDFAQVILGMTTIEAQNPTSGVLVQTPVDVGCSVPFQGFANAVKLGGKPLSVDKGILKLRSSDGAVMSVPTAKKTPFPPATIEVSGGPELTADQLRVLQGLADISDEASGSSPIGSNVYGDGHWTIGGTSVCIGVAYFPLCTERPVVIPASFIHGIHAAGQVRATANRFVVSSGDVLAWTLTLDTPFPSQAVADVIRAIRAGGRSRFRLAVEVIDDLARKLKSLQLVPADAVRFTGSEATIIVAAGRDDVASYRTSIPVVDGTFSGSFVLSFRSFAALARMLRATEQETAGFSVGGSVTDPVGVMTLGPVAVELALAQTSV